MLEAINQEKQIRLVVERDTNVGYYLYVYPIGSDQSIADHLCDDLECVFVEAEETYHVLRDKFSEKKVTAKIVDQSENT